MIGLDGPTTAACVMFLGSVAASLAFVYYWTKDSDQ